MSAFFNTEELELFGDNLNLLSEAARTAYFETTTKKLAGLTLRKVKERTPVGKSISIKDKNTGKRTTVHVGGNLRRNWNIGTVTSDKDGCSVTIINPTDYASYVEYGHRQHPGRYVAAIGKRLKKPWVQGRFMMRETIKDMELTAEHVIITELVKYLGDLDVK